jgi:sporulation integral membrane protein YtvI
VKEQKISMEALKQNKLLKLGIVSAAVYLFFRYLFPLIAPFALAFLFMTLCYPLLERLQKKFPVKKKFLAAGVILPLLLLVSGLLWGLFAYGTKQLDGLESFCAQAGEQIELFFHQCCGRLDGRFGWDGSQIERYVEERMGVVMENVQIQVVPQLLSSSYSCFRGIFSAIGFLAMTCIAAFLLEKDYTTIIENMKASEELRLVWAVVEGVLGYVVSFIKAQGVLLVLISLLCSVTLSIAGIRGGAFLGILAGCMDMLPFIGTGIVLVPLALWQLLNGRYVQLAGCLLLYGACVLLRELLEPKLIGKGTGIAPIWMLLAVYAGVKLFGVAGILKGPLGLVTIYEVIQGQKPNESS